MAGIANPANFASFGLQPSRVLDGGRMMMRGLVGIIGFALLLTALGLWLAPGANMAQDLLLMKLCGSVFGGMIGIGCLQSFFRPTPPHVEIDTIGHEVRLVRLRGKYRFVLDRCQFRDLTLVENSGTHVLLWGQDHKLIAKVAVTDRVFHCNLVTALRVAGKLV